LRNAALAGGSGLMPERSLPAMMMSRPRSVKSAACSTPACSRRPFSIAACSDAGRSESAVAIASALTVRSFSMLSSALRPRLRPPSSALSILTSNHDSMLFARNCTDTP
jgi:hypothetical protein